MSSTCKKVASNLDICLVKILVIVNINKIEPLDGVIGILHQLLNMLYKKLQIVAENESP